MESKEMQSFFICVPCPNRKELDKLERASSAALNVDTRERIDSVAPTVEGVAADNFVLQCGLVARVVVEKSYPNTDLILPGSDRFAVDNSSAEELRNILRAAMA